MQHWERLQSRLPYWMISTLKREDDQLLQASKNGHCKVKAYTVQGSVYYLALAIQP